MTKYMRTKQVCSNLRDEAGEHGTKLIGAVIGLGQPVWIIENDKSPHDGWGHIVGPTSGPDKLINADGTYKSHGKPAWVEMAHLEEVKIDKSIIKIEIDWDARTIKVI